MYKDRGTYRFRLNGKIICTGMGDKKAAEKYRTDLIRKTERQEAGLPVNDEQRRMTHIGDLVTEWALEMDRQGRCPAHRDTMRANVNRAANAMGMTCLAEFRLERFTAFLANLRFRGRSPRTLNAYRMSLKCFFQFCVIMGWAEDNPLRHFRAAASKKVRPKRAFTPEEFTRLCDHSYYPTLYTVAAMTGFRKGEMARLMKCHFKDEWWVLPSGFRKSKRPFIAPVHKELLPILLDHMARHCPEANSLLFPTLPTSRTFKADLARANIREVDESGRYVSFHSLRYTFCTRLNAAGLPIQTVKKLMDHSTIVLTMDLYNDLGLTDINDAVQSVSLGLTVNQPTLPIPAKEVPIEIQSTQVG